MPIFFSPDEVQYSLGVTSITAALQKAVNKKRFVREERTMDKVEKFERKPTVEHSGGGAEREGSRSDSQASQAPSHLPMQQSSAIMGKPVASFNIKFAQRVHIRILGL